MRLRHVLSVLFIVAISVVLFGLAGCVERMSCAPPNVMIGDTCCLDADNNEVCDTWEDESEEPEIVYTEQVVTAAEPEEDPYELAAETFAETWDRKSYNALRNLFVDDLRMKFSSQEWNFLVRKVDADMGIEGVDLVAVDGYSVTYEVELGGEVVKVRADLDEDDGAVLHKPFYFFEELSADAACGDDGECYMDFARISGDRNFCDKAGEFKVECVQQFGVSKGILEKIDDCLEITEMYSRADCLTELAVAENDIEPCWQATHDNQIYECMGKVAAARDDVDECDEFVSSRGYPGTRLQHAYCITGYVKETLDTDACAKIDRRSDVVLGAMQEGCTKLNFP